MRRACFTEDRNLWPGHLLAFSDKPMLYNEKIICFKDGSGSNLELIIGNQARVTEIYFISGVSVYLPAILRVIVDGKEYPVSTPERNIQLLIRGDFEVVLMSENWSLKLGAKEDLENNVIDPSDFIDVLENKISLDELMTGKMKEYCKERTAWAKRAERALHKIYDINEKGGHGSRKTVRELVREVMPNII